MLKPRKKILLISVSAGAGHLRAAEALKKTADQSFPDIESVHVDMMKYVKTPLKKAVVDTYDILIKQIPGLFGYLYKKTNDTEKVGKYRELTKYISRINATALYEYVLREKPDHIICTHFLPAQTLLEAPEKYAIHAPVSLVITDYDRHAFIAAPGVAHYFVSHEKIKWKMVMSGLEEKVITVSGIPIDPAFFILPTAQELRRQYGIPNNHRVFLIMSGGQGNGKMATVVSSLFRLATPATLIVITGKNKAQTKEVQALIPPPHITTKVLGWTDKTHEYMRLADAIITKPGGLTTSECLALEKPIIAVNPIPGQEEENVEYILEHGYGVVARTPLDLLYYASRPADTLAPGYTKKQFSEPRAADIILKTIST